MPLYKTHCAACASHDTRRLSFEDYDQVSAGALVLECSCGGNQKLVFDPTAVSFVLKDGASGGWATKAAAENKYRAARRVEMGRREKDHVKPNRLIPNYKGQIAGSWAEAKEQAYQSTYQQINREHGARTAATAANEAAKSYDTQVKREAT
jgi:hypothetical protein